MAAIEGILWVLFTLICVIVSGVILLQEGKGGGLGEAFGGAGAQTFGVKAEGIVKFTGYLSAALVLLALLITKIRSGDSVLPEVAPAESPASGAVAAPVEPAAPAGQSDEGDGK